METLYLKTLTVAAETRSFSKAAVVLNITQSAVSQRIKFIEERYGYQLFDRSGPLLVPTDAGKLVLKKAEAILALEREMQEELKQLGGKTRFSLCCTPTFGIVYLPSVLNSFMLKNADIVDLKFIFYTPEQALKGLQENEFDVAVVEHCEGLDFSEFQTCQLPNDELVFISAPSLKLPSPLVDLPALLQQRLIARKDGCSSKKLLKLNLAAMGQEIGDFRKMVIYDDLRLTIQTVADGGGISFVSRNLVQRQLQDGLLMEHHVEGFCHFRYRTIAISKKRAENAMLQDFLGSLFAVFEVGEAECGLLTSPPS